MKSELNYAMWHPVNRLESADKELVRDAVSPWQQSTVLFVQQPQQAFLPLLCTQFNTILFIATSFTLTHIKFSSVCSTSYHVCKATRRAATDIHVKNEVDIVNCLVFTEANVCPNLVMFSNKN